jgi:ubiquitin carboxyl-terminal hydrolase 10
LRAACIPEVLSDFNSPNQTTKQLQFEKLPPVLVISIKRFIFDEVRGVLKSAKHIEISSKLEIPSESLSRNAHLDFHSTHAYASSSSSSSNEEESEGKLSSKVYHLYAGNIDQLHPNFFYLLVVQHHGKFSEGGHYTSDILHQSDQWYRFDDSSVTTIDEKLVTGEQKDRQPYILFYIEKN